MSSKNEIAIFVSHRIDLPCETPNSDIYHPVRCGAVFDSSDAIIPGDNTGDNISDKRLSYCELTVQYWAWKNYTADYYGLCHYRRYFSFSDEIFKQERFNVIESKTIRETISKYNLEDTSKIRNEIERNDAIIPYGIDVRTVLTGVPGGKRFYPHNVIEFWKAKTDQIDPACLDKLVDIVKSLYPEYYRCLLDYLNGTLFFGGCCYVLKKDLFNK